MIHHDAIQPFWAGYRLGVVRGLDFVLILLGALLAALFLHGD